MDTRRGVDTTTVMRELAEQDPILVEVIEEVLAPYKARFAPEVVQHFREELMVLAVSHPYPSALLDALRARPAVSASTDVEKGDPAVDAVVDAIRKKERAR